MRSSLAPWLSAVLSAALVACAAGAPGQSARHLAAKADFRSVVLSGGRFHEQAWFSPGSAPSDTLHVYLDHDGTPFVDEHRPAADPTPRRPLGLELMTLDRMPSLYLGRPCHYRVDTSPPCDVLAYTHRRYSAAVVQSMMEALQGFLAQHTDYRRIVLIGYSGGGTLATLMAARMPDVAAVVTLAANLDVAEWTRRHDYSPLEGSLDPTLEHGPPDSVAQWHYVGSADTNVPPAVVRSYAATHPAAEVVELPDVDHTCCWEALWPDILKRLDRTVGP